MILLEDFRQVLIAEGWNPSFVEGMSDAALMCLFEVRRKEEDKYNEIYGNSEEEK